MYKRYVVSGEKGLLLFDLTNEQEVKVEMVDTGMEIEPLSVEFDGLNLVIRSNFFMVPNIIHEARLTWMGKCYRVTGSYALFGKIEGEAIPFTGMTKQETMVQELPSHKSGNVVLRTDEEIDVAVEQLLSKMTLEEKIGQMSQGVGRNVAAIGSEVTEIISEEEAIERGLVGSVIAMTGPGVIFEQQKRAVEKSRLGIPLLFCQDVIHGFETIFPIPLGWSCSFDTERLEKAMKIAAKEAAVNGIMMGFSPMLDIARDPRWGRVSEGNGEDPYLCSKMAQAHVKGFQGDSLNRRGLPNDEDTLIACAKHFVGYSAAESGRDYNTTEISESTLYNVYLPPFQAAVDAGIGSVMNAFNSLNGMPLVGNKRLCHDLLRHKMGFDGILISDFASVDELMVHGVAANSSEAAKLAIDASLDIEMGINHYMSSLKHLVDNGNVSEEQINTAVKRILTCKYKIGIMDDPYKYLQPEKVSAVYSDEHLKMSYDLASESAVLLKNNGTLPLQSGMRVGLIGPIGNSTDLLGPWQFSRREKNTVTILEALKKMDITVRYEEGSKLESKIDGGIEKAIALVEEVDSVVLCLGEGKHMSGEASSRQNIEVPEVQMSLAKAVTQKAKSLNKPVVLVLTNGRPLILEWFDEHVDAMIETWFLGSMAGHVIADLLTGKLNPSGKLSMSFPRHQGQIPIYYNHLRTGRPFKEGDHNKFLSKYLDGSNLPLYPFGYGLSYSRFEFTGTGFFIDDEKTLQSKAIMNPDEVVKVVTTVTNTGKVAGTEVVQLYMNDCVAGIARPVKEMIGFSRVSLEPGEQVRVEFVIDRDRLAYLDHEYRRTLEPGTIMLMIGNSSLDKDLTILELEVK